MFSILSIFLVISLFIGVYSVAPVSVIANVRGKRYDVTATTVEEFSTQIEGLTGIEAAQQNVIFRGKVLNTSDKLEELGINEGEVLNVVKGRKARISPVAPKEASSLNSPLGTTPSGLGDVPGVDPEQMKKAMKAMDNLLDSNFIDEYFSDEEKMEKSRLQMLENLDQYEQMMPGFKEQAKEIASDPAKWKQAMDNAKQQMIKLKQQRDELRASGKLPPVDPSASGFPTGDNTNAVDDFDESPK